MSSGGASSISGLCVHSLRATTATNPRFADLLMFVTAPGGHERTEAEFRALLGEAGFSLMRAIPTAGFIYHREQTGIRPLAPSGG
jgi:O-methyltransferase domain